MSDIHELINEIHNRGTELLQVDKSGKGYVCPLCGSGTGKKGTGIKTYDGVHYICFKGCFSHSDIIDIVGMKYGVTADTDKIKKTAELLNIDTTSYFNTRSYTSPPKPEAIKTPSLISDFNKWHDDIDKTTYHRGISKATLDKYLIGYCQNWVHPKTPKSAATERLIIPTSQTSYIARATENTIEPRIQKVGNISLFNIKGLSSDTDYIFIVEGEIDALSIIDLGFNALGLGGTSGAKTLLSTLEDERTEKTLILALDNDAPGNAAQEGLIKGLEDIGIEYYSSDVAALYGGLKDANECLNQDREAFTERLQAEIKRSQEAREEHREHNLAVLNSESIRAKLPDFYNRIRTEKRKPIPTGFKKLDEILGGGLFPGLYTIGALASLGKTTFLHQMADQIADKDGANKRVLFYSLEMDTDEIISKSISRLTYLQDGTADKSLAMTTRGILTGSRYEDYTDEQQKNIGMAIGNYAIAINDNLFIKEAEGRTTYEEIDEEIKRHINITGEAPVVMIDYLQIMTPISDRLSDKQAVDRQVMELKRISRKYKTPMILISSLNRENYTTEINIAAYKESGAIEYSSDVLIGLQYKEIDYSGSKDGKGKVHKAIGKLREAQTPKEIELKVLKNRNGQLGETDFTFYPYFNYFEEAIF